MIRGSRLPWMLVGAGALAAMGLVLLEDLGSTQLYALTLHLPGVDKVLHFSQSFVICYVFSLLLARTGVSWRTRIVLAAAGALAAAGFDELQQSFQSDRNIEAADIAAGATGILAAVAVLSRLRTPRLAAVAMVIALVAAGGLTYATFLRLHDYNEGVLAEQAGNRDEALRHYVRAADSGSDNPEVYNAAAWLIAEMPGQDANRAVRFAERSLQLRPASPDTLDTYGWSLYRAGRPADALVQLQQALEAKPDIYCIHYHLGMVLLDLNRRDEAIRHLQQQVNLMPNTNEARLAADRLAGLHQSARQ